MNLTLFKAASPTTAIILGSGMSDVADAFRPEAELAFSAVRSLGEATVPGHSGRFILGRHAGQAIVISQGRRHLYEGLKARAVTAGVRFLYELGVRRVLFTNAAGAIDPAFHIGGLMLIRDHLNLTGTSPLEGPQFIDMSAAYSAEWRQRLRSAALDLRLSLYEGVYAGVVGPQYETPAEVQMLRILGAQAVGMSTVLEVIQARALGMEVAALSLLTNWAAGLAPAEVSHGDVLSTGARASANLAALLKGAL
jgi:purine-nucleoside phosphorylase